MGYGVVMLSLGVGLWPIQLIWHAQFEERILNTYNLFDPIRIVGGFIRLSRDQRVMFNGGWWALVLIVYVFYLYPPVWEGLQSLCPAVFDSAEWMWVMLMGELGIWLDLIMRFRA